MNTAEIKALREKRKTIHEGCRDLMDKPEGENGNLSDEQSQEFDRRMAEIDTLTETIEREERLEDIGKRLDIPAGVTVVDEDGPSDETKKALEKRNGDADFYAWLRNGDASGAGRQSRDFERRAIGESQDTYEKRAAQTVTTTGGGYLIPNEFSNALEKSLLAFGGMRALSRVIQTATGAQLDWPTMDDTSNKGSILAINIADGEQALTFGTFSLDAYKYTSDIVLVPVELLQDSFSNFDQIVGEALGERLGRILNEHATTGTGSSQPNGVVTASSAGKTAASSSTVTYAELVDLQHSLDPAYRNGANFMFHDNTLAVIKKLVDSQARPLWMPGIAVREPNTILGHNYAVNQDMATMEASAKSILFGDFNKYIWREVLGIQLLRLTERYAEKLQVGFIAFLRFDGDLIDAGTDPMKHLLHPSP